MTDAAEIDRLTTRLERERRARRQAEAIAERGMRELWETNRELQLRVEQRTGDLERRLIALSLVQRHLLAEVASSASALQAHGDELPEECATALRRLAAMAVVIPSPEAHEPAEASVTDVADGVLDRWQRTAAASRQLLSVVAGPGAPILARWDQVTAVVDLVLGGITCHGPSGATVVSFMPATAAGAGVEVEFTHSGWARRQSEAGIDPTVEGASLLGPIEPILSVAGELAASVGGTLRVIVDDGGLRIVASFPPDR